MRILDIKEFTTEEGTGKETMIPLDVRPGVFFRVITGTFETPLFTREMSGPIPVIMNHADRDGTNVSININNDDVLIIKQGYRQASYGYLVLQVNNDWSDTSELTPVVLDATEISAVQINGGNWVDVSASISGVKVNVKSNSFTPTLASYNVQTIQTKDGTQYIFPQTFTSNTVSTDPVKYNYFRALIDRAITAYKKP